MSTDYELRVLDRTVEANTSLWSALITANSILAGVGAALAAVIPKAPIAIWVALILAAAVSLWLLILNFRAIRDQYESIGQRLTGKRAVSADDMPRAEAQREKLKRREKAATRLLFLELGLIVGGIVWSACRT